MTGTGIGAGFTEESLREADVPVCIVVSDTDRVAPASTKAKRNALYILYGRLSLSEGERGHDLAPISPEQRRAELREVAELALKFFRE